MKPGTEVDLTFGLKLSYAQATLSSINTSINSSPNYRKKYWMSDLNFSEAKFYPLVMAMRKKKC